MDLRYIYYYGGKTHAKEFGAKEVERFLSDLAVKRNISASTQRQALNALIFLYRNVLDMLMLKPQRNIPMSWTKTSPA